MLQGGHGDKIGGMDTPEADNADDLGAKLSVHREVLWMPDTENSDSPRKGRGLRTPKRQVALSLKNVIGQDDANFDIEATPKPPSMPALRPPQSSHSSARSQSPDKMAALKNIQGGLDYAMVDGNDVLEDGEQKESCSGLTKS
ncbi:hypothetical protein LTR74_017695 [Friedmanniomyces endolithicus]|nr:hypothetical protein LTR74_017695 [Friedmanniomyces endolithicus]